MYCATYHVRFSTRIACCAPHSSSDSGEDSTQSHASAKDADVTSYLSHRFLSSARHFFHHLHFLNSLLLGLLVRFFLNCLVFAPLIPFVLQRRCCRRSFTASPHALRQRRARHGHAASGARRSRCYFSQRRCPCCRCARSPSSRTARAKRRSSYSIGREVITPLIHACKHARLTRGSGAHSLGQPPRPLQCGSAHRF